jgi:hypothetical protein
LDSVTTATPALPIIETVSDSDVTNATSAGTDVPDAPPGPDSDEYFASSGLSLVHHLEEVDAAISDTDDMIFEGIDGTDPRAMSMFDLNVPDSAKTHYDNLGALDRQVKALSTASRAPHRFGDILRRVILSRSTSLRCAPRTPMPSTVSNALTLTMSPKL